MSDKSRGDCLKMASSNIKAICQSDIQTELLNAWRKKDLEGFKAALEKDGCEVDHVYDNNDYMRMIDSASQDGYTEYLKVLIEAGANINSNNPVHSKAPIHLAVEYGQLEILKLLVSKGADINIRDSSGSTPLHYLVKQNWQPGEIMHKQCLQFLLEQDGLELNSLNGKGLTAIHQATIKGVYEAIKMLLEKGSHLDLDSSKVGIKKKTAREEILQKYPELEKDLPPMWTPEKAYEIKMDGDKLFNLLHRGLEERFCEKFKQEIQDKAQKSLLTYTNGECTFLQYSCREGMREAVETLIEAGADVNHGQGDRPILIACKNGDPDILRLLLKTDKPDLSPDKSGDHPLHIVAKKSKNSPNHIECLEILLRREETLNLDINAQDVKGNTPLHYAVKYGDKKCVDILINHGAYIGTLNRYKESPLSHMSSSTLGNYLDSFITSNDLQRDDSNYAMIFDYNFLSRKKYQKKLEEAKIPLEDDAEAVDFIEKKKEVPTPECDPLLYISRSHLKKLLLHPVLSSFILLKWQRIQIYYFINLLFYSLFCLLLTIYILFGYRTIANPSGEETSSVPSTLSKLILDKDVPEISKKDGLSNSVPENSITNTYTSSTEPSASIPTSDYTDSIAVLIVRLILSVYIFVLALREIFQILIHPKKYFLDLENWLEILLLFVSTFIVAKDCSREFSNSDDRLALWCPQFCALAILLSWFELVLLIGKHPLQSLHIEMFKTVSINFLKFLAWYVILIIAFALTFYVLFRGCHGECEENKFPTLGNSFFKTVVMLTGEFEASEIVFIGIGHLIFIAFVFLIAIVLINLLMGLAVTDTQIIRDDSYLYKLISLVKLISFIENMLLTETDVIKIPFIRCFKKSPKTNALCDYFARRIVFFPNLLPERKIYVLLNENYRILFSDPKSFVNKPNENNSCISLSNYYLESSAAKTAEKTLSDRQSEEIKPDNLMNELNSKIEDVKKNAKNLDKKLEALEQSTKQNEKLLIQLLAILSLNNANNEDR